ncbi:MAG: hypothetical protein ACOCXI_13900 [Chloroflexota bacterium]
MLQPTLSAIRPETIGPLLVMIAFGAYHGLNPGMGWLFALSLGLQKQSERAIWVSMLPIAAGHAASLVIVAVLVLAGAQFVSTTALKLVTAVLLIGFGIYKIFNYYRHPRWVGMQVSMGDLVWWSFLMAMAHGAGLMIAPALLSMADDGGMHRVHATHVSQAGLSTGLGMSLGVLMHTLSMLAVMGIVAWVVYRYVGLAILRRRWVNFDLIWAAALLIVGGAALLNSIGWI